VGSQDNIVPFQPILKDDQYNRYGQPELMISLWTINHIPHISYNIFIIFLLYILLLYLLNPMKVNE
jgi:hypothetical protein